MAEPVYATTTDLANLGMLSAGALANIPVAAQNAALSARSRWIDGYLRTKFVLPLVAWGDDLKRAVVDAAVYDLATQRGVNPEAGADINFRLRYEDAERWAHGIAKELTPDVTDSSSLATQGVGQRPRVASSSQRGWSSRGTTSGQGGGQGGPFTGD